MSKNRKYTLTFTEVPEGKTRARKTNRVFPKLKEARNFARDEQLLKNGRFISLMNQNGTRLPLSNK